MIEIEGIAGENIVTYDSFQLRFDAPLAIIRGDNRAGKSLIQNSIGNLRYGSAPLDDKRGSGARMHSKGSSLRLWGRRGNRTWEFTQLAKGRGLGYKILLDGEAQTIRTAQAAMEIMEEQFPMGKDLFYTTVSLSSYRPTVMHVGTAPQRRAYFENIFDFSIHDALQDLISARISGLRGDRTRLAVMQERKELLAGRRINLEEARARRAALADRVNKINLQLDAVQKNITDLTAWVTLAEGLHSDLDVPALQARERELSTLVRRARDTISEHAAATEARRAYDRLQGARTRLQAELDSIGVRPDKPALRRLESMVRALQNVQRDLRDRARVSLQRAEAEAALAAANLRLKQATALFRQHGAGLQDRAKTEGWTSILNDTRAQMQAVRSTVTSLRHIRERHERDCPSCGQAVHGEHAARVLSGMTAELARLTDLYGLAEILADRADCAEALRRLPDETSPDLLRGAQERARLLAGKIEIEVFSYEQAISLRNQIDAIPQMDEPPQLREVDLPRLRERLQMNERALEECRSDIRLRERLAQMTDYGDPAAARSRLDRARATREQGSTALREMNTHLHNIASRISAGEMVHDELEQLERQVAETEARVADLPIYDALMAAYGAKGLRILQIRNLAAMFEANLNSYANLIFGEPFRFELHVDENRFDVLAERSGGISEIAGSLSGSESRCFQVLCLPAMLPFVAASQRANLCMLDEMESGMDEASQELYTTSFLPMLRSVVPHVVLVTPFTQQRMFLPDAVEYRVSKRTGRSVLARLGEG